MILFGPQKPTQVKGGKPLMFGFRERGLGEGPEATEAEA